jgi:NADH-quinone oxidoreductase subunit C/D
MEDVRKLERAGVMEELSSRFPDAIQPERRQGYEGFIVEPGRLLEIATTLRDDLQYDYLASLTGVDYIDEQVMEVVYHLSMLAGGPPLTMRVRTPRQDPQVPSLTAVYPGADFQEREAWDLLGIRFSGHPDLKRILTWEGFHGHPLRKDWHEPTFEEEAKPFASRYPDGRPPHEETSGLHGKYVQYPPDFSPEGWVPEGELGLYEEMEQAAQGGDGRAIETDQIIVNFGPQHPSTHGVFRVVAALDGETIIDLKPVMGYLHRNHEKIGERNTFVMNMPFTDRLDYITSMSNNFGYALAVEKLTGKKPPERAEYIRVMMAELTRIVSHLWGGVGFLLNDLGAYFTPMLYAIQERELILDVFEAVSGSRMMCNYFRFGGVARDLPEGTLDVVRELVFERLPRRIDELDTYLTDNEIVRTRTIGVGCLPKERAMALSAAGPLLRASGVPYDLRKADPYSVYQRFAFDIPVRQNGDVYDRYLVRLDEMRQSLRILRQVLDDMPGGEIQEGKSLYQVRVPPGEAYGRVEGPKGELGFYIVSNGKANPWRYHIRPPSFINLTALREMCIGQKIADVVVIIGSMDITLGEVDR